MKGAYLDSEIKCAKIDGLDNYQVYIRKIYTNKSYPACTRKLLLLSNLIYPQFTSNNANTLVSIYYRLEKIIVLINMNFNICIAWENPSTNKIVSAIANGNLTVLSTSVY